MQHEIVQYIKRVQHEKSAKWKDYYTEKWNIEMVRYEKSATWIECNMKKVQHEKYKLPQWNMEKVHKNSAL